MGHRLLISDGTVARNVPTNYMVVQDGLVKAIKRALVVQNGIAHEYWPAAPNSEDQNILWDKFELTVTKYETLLNQPAVASINFAVDGTYNYDNDSGLGSPATGNGTYLAIAPPASNYLIRADYVSGSNQTVGDSLGVWLDASVARSWGNQKAESGIHTTVMDITVAAGNVTPNAGTEVIKRVTFNSNVVDEGTKVGWNDTQRDLVEITDAKDPDCELRFNPNGTAQGFADTSGAFIENWHVDATSVPDPENYTVNVTLVSGTAPTGSALGVTLPLNNTESWTLLATFDQDLSCELNVTVSDGTVSITKRVTMNAKRGAEPSVNVWTTAEWTLVDIVVNPTEALAQLIVNTNGTAIGDTPAQTAFNEDWSSKAPNTIDSDRFECRLLMLTGENPEPEGAAINTWIPITFQLLWEWKLSALGSQVVFKDATAELQIREIGQPSVDKPITVQINTESDGSDGGGGTPIEPDPQ